MVGSFFKEATVLILFCHIFVNAEDLLEVFRPNPSLPQELNEWLSQVQEHKGDFRLIRDSVGEQPKNLIHFSEDYDGEETKNEDVDDLSMRDDYRNQKSGPFDDRPHNDIYPNMFRGLKDDNFPPFRKTYLKREPPSSRYAKSPIRLRRSSNHVPFFEHDSPVNVVPVGKIGELKRSQNKYPDSYSRGEEDVVGKSGRSVKLNDLKKREIQIDIKNDGKLVKKIYEDTKNPKSIVLNIQSPEVSKDQLENLKDTESNLNFEKGYKSIQQNPQDLTSKTKNAPGLNIRSDFNRMKNKELINNFNNLFSANEHLNTDNSLAHETSTQNHLIYHVVAPQATSAPHFNFQHYHGYDTIGTANASIVNNKFSRQNSFNGNNMQDMSGFWTNFEKNQLQKGLDRARVNKNHLAQKVTAIVKDHDEGKVKENANGFEPAQTIELDDGGDSNGKVEGTYRTDNLRSTCDESCSRANGLNSPTCAACMNRMNNFNSWSNLNDGKDSNLTNINAMNGLNDVKLISELSTTDNLLNANGMGGLNGLSYNLGVNRQENNKLAGENSFGNSRGTSREENKRQLEVPEESLQLIDNDNFRNDVVGFTNWTGNDNVDAYNNQYVTEAKRNDEIFQTNLLERDITTTALSGELPHSVDTVDLYKSPKTVDGINLQSDIESPLNSNEEMMNSEHDDNFSLNEKEVRVVHDEVPILIGKTGTGTNEGFSNGDTEPIATIEHEIPDNTVGKVHQSFDELPLPMEHVAGSEQLQNEKHEKTVVHKINKAVKDDKKVTKIETITETDDADTGENEEEMDIDYCNGLEEDNNKLHEIEGAVPSSRLEKEHREEETAIEASLEPQKSQGRGHVNEEVEDLDPSNAPHAGIHKELHFPHHEKQNDDEEETIIDIKHHQKAVHRPTSHEHCHNIEEHVPRTGNGPRGNSYYQHVQNRRKTYHSPEKNKHNKKKKHFERMKPKHYHNYINDIPAELIINKRGDRNEIHPRKRYRKRHYMNGQLFNDFDTQEYGNMIDEDVNIGTSTDSKDLIPAYIGRQLKAVDYVYDAYLHRPGVNFDEELPTELQEISSKKTNVVHMSTSRQRKHHHVGLLHKNSAEGDYGEEEDSVTETPKKDNNVMIKKTKNEFANPETTTESEDYDNYDNYDGTSTIKRERPKPKHERRKQKKKGGSRERQRRKQSTELKGHDVKSFAHHGQKYKPKLRKDKKPRSAVNTQYQKENDDDLPSKLWSPVYHSDANKFSKLVLENANSDFQHWPSFVTDDRQNEEMLRKRSPIANKKYQRAFSFPVSMKDFFVKPQKKAGQSEVKREKPNSLLLDENLANENKQPQDEVDKALSTERGLNAADTAISDEEISQAACTERVAVTNVCEDKENFNKTSVQLTTILSMTVETSSEIQDECNNNTDIEEAKPQERLDDILNGKLPFQLVSEILETLSKNSKLKDRFHKGLKKSGPDKNFLRSLNETNMEAQKLVQSMTNIVNKLQYTATCQALPSTLRHYIKFVTRGIKSDPLAKTREMEEIEFDENQNQDSFVFQSSSQSDSFEGKVKIFQDLLNRFNKLSEKCKTRAMPVKEYIENHLGMLNNMLNINANSNAEKNTKPKKSIEHVQDESVKTEDELIQEQLESLGLGKQKRFKPKFDLDQMVEESKRHKSSTGGQSRATARPRGANVNKRDLKSVSRSKKYDKLVDAVRRLRLRREGEKRLAEMYGNRGADDYGGIHFNLRSEGDEDMAKANFESPLVYSF